MLPFHFLHQRAIFGGDESWLNREFPSSAASFKQVVARDIDVSVELEKVDDQAFLKRCAFVFGPEAFWSGRRTKDRLIGRKQIAIDKCKVEYKVVTLDRSALGTNSPIEWTATETIILADKSNLTNSIKYRLIEYSTDPISQKEFLRSAKIPLGHTVAVEGAPQLSYVWNGEWAVPESEMLAATRFSTVGTIWRTIGLIAFIVIPVFALHLYRVCGQCRVAK